MLIHAHLQEQHTPCVVLELLAHNLDAGTNEQRGELKKIMEANIIVKMP